MALYKCKNFGSCSRADIGEELSLAAGADDKCPECGSTLVPVGDVSGDSPKGEGFFKRKPVVVSVIAGAIFLVLAGVGYSKWSGDHVVTLTPDTLPTAISSAPPTPVASTSTTPVSAPEEKNSQQSGPILSNEISARKTCDEATKAKQPDADKVCRRAAAITLMNSGVLSAVDGKLDQAERDYLAAREKDPEFPELYFNIAVLKARQNKGTEAIDNLILASSKGFTQFAAIKGEPALQKLKSDPLLKQKIEELEKK